jgi:hypothetical protein
MKNFYKICLLMFCCTQAQQSMADVQISNLNNNYGYINKIHNITNDKDIQNRIRALLGGSDYVNFTQNFENFGAPYQLHDGGLYYEGWKNNKYLKNTSSIVVYPDGRLYISFFLPESNTLKYFTNDKNYANTLHPAIGVFKRQLGKNVNVTFATEYANVLLDRNSSSRATKVVSTSSTPSAPDATDQQALKTVAASIWNDSLASGWDMNVDVGNVLSDATGQILTCSQSFALVPKPAGFLPGWFYLAKNAGSVVYYFSGLKQNTTYKACVSAAALNYRSAIEMASLGI